MSFWEDSSPIVKVAIIVGVLGILYLGIAWGVGLFPFPGKCTYEVDGAEQSGCPADANCVDGECVQQTRGIQL